MAAKKAGPGNLKLPAVLDLNEAATLHGHLMNMRGSDIVIDASGVERVGAQCVQILVAGARAWHQDQKSFLVEKTSESFEKTMQLIGVDPANMAA